MAFAAFTESTKVQMEKSVGLTNLISNFSVNKF